jgi:hypothetical protein
MHAAESEAGDYSVELVMANGRPAPRILLALPGQPALYLTERAVFHGPPPHRFSLLEPLRIPAPALECANGVNFLQQLNLDLPPRITQRIRKIDAIVTVSCQLKPNYPGSDTESVFINVTAKLAGGTTERCGSWGWQVAPNSNRTATAPSRW